MKASDLNRYFAVNPSAVQGSQLFCPNCRCWRSIADWNFENTELYGPKMTCPECGEEFGVDGCSLTFQSR